MALRIREEAAGLPVYRPGRRPPLRQVDGEAFLDRVPDDVAVVLDEAYVEFVDDPAAVTGLSLLDRPNVVVLRTFSKAYGLAGLRIGYAVAPAEHALLERVDELVVRRAAMLKSLRDLGHDVPDAQGNFVWLPSAGHTHHWTNVFADAGVMVRPYASPGPGGEHGPFDGIRITVGEPEANDLALRIATRLAP